MTADISQEQNEIPQPSTTVSPIDLASISNLPHELPESSIPTVHIPNGDSDDDIPLSRLRKKRKMQETLAPSTKR